MKSVYLFLSETDFWTGDWGGARATAPLFSLLLRRVLQRPRPPGWDSMNVSGRWAARAASVADRKPIRWASDGESDTNRGRGNRTRRIRHEVLVAGTFGRDDGRLGRQRRQPHFSRGRVGGRCVDFVSGCGRPSRRSWRPARSSVTQGPLQLSRDYRFFVTLQGSNFRFPRPIFEPSTSTARELDWDFYRFGQAPW